MKKEIKSLKVKLPSFIFRCILSMSNLIYMIVYLRPTPGRVQAGKTVPQCPTRCSAAPYSWYGTGRTVLNKNSISKPSPQPSMHPPPPHPYTFNTIIIIYIRPVLPTELQRKGVVENVGNLVDSFCFYQSAFIINYI